MKFSDFFNFIKFNKDNKIIKTSDDVKNFNTLFSQTGFSSSSRLAPSRALYYYSNIAPLFTAINYLSNEVGWLDVYVNDKKNLKILDNHDIIKLLKQPNADITQFEFMTQLASFFKITGNAFLIATGPVNRQPLELFVVSPLKVQIELDKNGDAEEYKVNLSYGNDLIFKQKDVDGRYRYYTSDGDFELWHIKTFCPNYGNGDPWGMSDLAPIVPELEQYMESSLHNLSLLKRGTAPSGALTTKNMMTDDQFNRLQSQMRSFFSGGANAGRVMLLDPDMDFKPLSQSNRDMDFAQLKSDISKTIYNALKIPLAMVSGEFSSYNNLETAKLNFYDNAVLPLARRLLEELSIFLLPRYKNSEYLELTIDTDDIDALSIRYTAEITALRDSGVLTINEIRAKMGYDPIEGGDTLYISASNIPISSAGIDFSISEQEAVQKLLNENFEVKNDKKFPKKK